MKNRWILWGAVCLLLSGLVVAMVRIHFDWGIFWRQLRSADPLHLLLGVICIYFGYILRAVRWAVFLRPQKRVPPATLIGTQVVGFTAVALFGRLADLVRPYLVAKRVDLSVSSQIAVYAVERMFDALAMAIIFCSALLVSPDLGTLPHHEALIRTSWIGLIVAIAGGIFALLTRTHGIQLARAIGNALRGISPGFAATVEARILSFRDGMNVLRTFPDFAWALLLSLVMWALIILAYFEVVHAFASLSMLHSSRIMLVMAASMAGSILQLPVIGWFTQIGLVSAAMKGLGAPLEPSLGAAALLLIVTFLSVIPLGIIFARIEHVSLRNVTRESEHLEAEELGVEKA
jgi:glycosyltransferase 2 family protein